MRRAFLFDLDGTLLNTAPDLFQAINALRLDFDLPPLSFDTALSMVGKGAHNLIHRALSHHSQIQFDLNDAYTRFARHYHHFNGQATTAYADVDITLRHLRDNGHALALVTNKPTEFTLPLITQFAWQDLFGSVVCGDTLDVKKPDAKPLQYACKQLQVSTQHALMVGDSMNDVLAARSAGCACVVLDYGYNEGTPIRQALFTARDVMVHTKFADITMYAQY